MGCKNKKKCRLQLTRIAAVF